MRSSSRRSLAIGVLSFAFLLGSCKGETTGPSTPQVTALAAFPNPATVRVDETLVMVLTMAADSGADRAIIWRSADPRRVSVTETGILTGISVGTAVVTAQSAANPNLVAIVPVSVIPAYTGVHRVVAAPQALTLIPGQAQGVSVTVEADSKVSRDVRFVSDSPSVATVSATGLVTARAQGSARITARSVADSNMATVISVTVRAPTATRVSLHSITSRGTGVPVDLQNVTGQADVLVNVEPGEGVLERIDLVVRNNSRDTVVASQTFGVSQALAANIANGAASTLVLSFRTDAYDPVTGKAAFRNGASSIKVVAVSTSNGSASQEASSGVVAYLNNADGFLVSARGLSSTGVASAVDAYGRRWMQTGRGLVVTTIPVSFSGRAVGSRTISFPGSAPAGAVVSSKPGTAVDTLMLPAGYATTAAGDGYLSGELPSIVAADSQGNSLSLVPATVLAQGRGGAGVLNAQASYLNGARLEGIRVDNSPPPPATLVISPALQNTNNWINGSYVFASGISGITADVGVGLPGPAAAPTVESAGITVLVTGGSLTDTTQVTTGADLPASNSNTAYNAVARYADRLGNVRIVPLTGAGAHPASTFGVDIQPPTIRYATGSLTAETLVSASADSIYDSATGGLGPRAFAIDAIDDRSGLATDRVFISLTRLAQPSASGTFTGTTTCIIGGGGACVRVPALFESVLPDLYRQHTTPMVGGGTAVEGYYTFTATVMDQAGNVSEVRTKRALLDAGTGGSAALLTGVGISGVLLGGQTAAFLALATDNVELARGGVLVEYPNLPGGAQMLTYATPQSGASAPIGTAFDANLTSPVAGTHAAFSMPGFIRALETVSAADAPHAYAAATVKPVSANAWVRDFAPAGAPATLAANVAIAPASVESPPGATPGFLALAGTANEVQQWRRVAGAGTLRFETVGATGQAVSPFARVILARLEPSGLTVNPNVWRVLSELTTPVGLDNGIKRVWTYDFGSQSSGSYVAIGITTAGDALATRLTVY